MTSELVASRLIHPQSDRFPAPDSWQQAQMIDFCRDWQGNNEDPLRRTEVRALWIPDTLFLRFDCHYREIVVFEDSEANGRRDGLWDRDVAEVFLQPDRFGSRHYSEIEVAPNGMWLDLEIFPSGRRPLESGMYCKTEIKDSQLWSAQLAIPMKAITSSFDPSQPWRANFYRCEGRDPSRWYSAWQPTHTPQPAFHVPEKFGVLRFD